MTMSSAELAPPATALATESRTAAFVIPIVALLIVALIAAVMTWGVVALTLAAVAATPVIFTVLILITQGK